MTCWTWWRVSSCRRRRCEGSGSTLCSPSSTTSWGSPSLQVGSDCTPDYVRLQLCLLINNHEYSRTCRKVTILLFETRLFLNVNVYLYAHVSRIEFKSLSAGCRCVHARRTRAATLDGLGCNGCLLCLGGSVLAAAENVRPL